MYLHWILANAPAVMVLATILEMLSFVIIAVSSYYLVLQRKTLHHTLLHMRAAFYVGLTYRVVNFAGIYLGAFMIFLGGAAVNAILGGLLLVVMAVNIISRGSFFGSPPCEKCKDAYKDRLKAKVPAGRDATVSSSV